MCIACHDVAKRQQSVPTMYQETVPWEVDPTDSIATCKVISEALRVTLKVYHDRPCLGFPYKEDIRNRNSSYEETEYVSTNTSKTNDNSMRGTIIDYHWLSYGEVLTCAVELGLGLK